MKYLLEDTFDAQTKWRFIGLYLGFIDSKLSAIKANNPSSEEQYREMLSQWINEGSATVKNLIDALEANTVRMNGIAKKLREKYEKRAQQEGGSLPLTTKEREVFEKRKKLRKRFNNLVEEVRELTKAKYTVNSFRTLLCSLPPKYRDEHISFVGENIPHFSKAKEVEEIFLYLGLYWSFLSPGLLEYILDELEDEEYKQKLKCLNADVAEFRKTTPLKVYWKVEDVDTASKPIPNAELWQLVTVHKPEYLSGSSTLEDVEIFRKQFAITFTIDKVALCISKISPGSVQVSWSVPSSVAPLLLADMQEHPEKLEQLGLISATISAYSQGKMEFNTPVHFNLLGAFLYR